MLSKSVRTMMRLQRHIVLLAIAGTVLILALASAYKTAAEKGLLNEKAQKKYEMQELIKIYEAKIPKEEDADKK